MVKLWLDDTRLPPDLTWVWVKRWEAAIPYFTRKEVDIASLDHDLGACPVCIERWRQSGGRGLRGFSCAHVGTGYDLLCWLEQMNLWPQRKPLVHSLNPVGRHRMQQLLDRVYRST